MLPPGLRDVVVRGHAPLPLTPLPEHLLSLHRPDQQPVHQPAGLLVALPVPVAGVPAVHAAEPRPAPRAIAHIDVALERYPGKWSFYHGLLMDVARNAAKKVPTCPLCNLS